MMVKLLGGYYLAEDSKFGRLGSSMPSPNHGTLRLHRMRLMLMLLTSYKLREHVSHRGVY